MQRVITGALLGIGALAAVFWLPDSWFLVTLAAVTALGAYELARLGRHWTPHAPLRALIFLVPLSLVGIVARMDGGLLHHPFPALELVLGGGLVSVVVGLLILFGRTPVEESLPGAGILSFGTAYLALPGACIWWLKRTDPWLVVLLLVVVASNDALAFYVGSTLGRRKMAPRISPNKTWEGAAGGLAAGVLAAALWSYFRLGTVEPLLLVMGLVVTVCAQCGDLVESMLKRGAGVKDSGRLLPGHGGVLDRVDALLFAAPVLSVALGWLGETVLRQL